MRNPRTVLIVDDDKNMRSTLSTILQREGYTVGIAERGEIAIEMMSKFTYDVILMDVRMPGIDGVEAFRRIQNHRRGVRVILMSAFSRESLKTIAFEEGAIAFLDKPLDIDRLIKLIGEVKDTAVLIVEEDDAIAAAMREELTAQGYWVTTTAHPADAVALVKQIKFDIIFIDAQLQTTTGLDLYIKMRRFTPGSVVIMITGVEEQYVRIAQEAVRRTAYTYVRKPLNLDDMLDLLAKITGQRASDAIMKPSIEST